MNTEYATMAPAALAGSRYVRLWIDESSAIRQADPLHAGLDKIVWQAGGHVYWFEMTEPTLQNVRDGIDSVLERGHGYRALVGATKQGTGLLHEDPEQPLPLAEMIPISTDVHIRTWWAMNTQSELMDMLFYGHRTQGEDGTPAPVGFDFGSRHNRDPSLLTDHRIAMAVTTTTTTTTICQSATSLSRPLQPQGKLQTGARPRGLERCTPAIRRMSTNRNQTLMLFPMPASHHLLVSKLLPILVTWTLVP